MGTKLTDVLIELSTPSKRREFQKDPRAFAEARGLSTEDQRALLDGDSAALWKGAKSVEHDDPAQQFNRLAQRASDLLIEIDPVIEVHIETNSLTAELPSGAEQLVVDEEGRLYKVAAAA
ncbi:hypothetical protein IVB25_00160 [Bradyrhizobium sp. 193]|jgi:hypothetical protein|uniref:hypothetical protein n=1 Tax=unclassified Bradyrhizobium TaxID=2631580 RepID=UPI001FF8C82C|nr:MULTISPECIES: hypothetical protein [unclassified Bradyrhizobium]MCK1466848.1 hypothetical protein [Bradyrhizobium sp. CW10]MCK1481222.1 hypothetical protein [Bradyrhizobium sp. 193]